VAPLPPAGKRFCVEFWGLCREKLIPLSVRAFGMNRLLNAPLAESKLEPAWVSNKNPNV